MIKGLIKTISVLFVIIIIIIFYLSFFGINTKSLNGIIKSEVKNLNKKINLELKSVKLLLDISNFSINIKTYGPEVFVKNNKLELEFIKTNIPLKSFINKEFSVDDLQISTKAIEIKDLIILIRSFKNSAELFVLDKLVKNGLIVGDINLNFDSNGKIKNDYEIKGFIKKGELNILRKYFVNDLNFIFNITKESFNFEDIEGKFNQIKLSSPFIKVKEKNDQFLISGKLINKKTTIDPNIIINLLEKNYKNHKIENLNLESDSDFSFIFSKKLKISDFNLKTVIILNDLVYKNDLLKIKEYFPNFKKLIMLEDHKIQINFKKNQLEIDGNGKIIFEDKIDNINYKIKKNQNQYIFNSKFSIIKNPFLINVLQYEKKENIESFVRIKGIYEEKSGIGQTKLNLISFNENKNFFIIKNLNLDNNLKIKNFNLIDLDYINNEKIKNQLTIKRNKKNYEIIGTSFDISKIIDEAFKETVTEDNSIFKDLNSQMNIKIRKTYLDKDTFVNNLTGFVNFKNNKINKSNLVSKFSNNKKLELTINTNNQNEKITTLFSEYPKPFVNRYKFIKGFEGGVMDFYSIKKDGISNSLLTINNFKVREVPVFAKLLSLASLQGIADLMTGEGIRFTDFEMKFSSKKGLLRIEELYSIGPAVSILMDGYIETKKLISLRGTLVPATTINKTIASIPLIGNLLVGKKSGEGVFGVSFKIKGPPNDLKTSVNPVKTLTPRFITRTLEKLKNN